MEKIDIKALARDLKQTATAVENKPVDNAIEKPQSKKRNSSKKDADLESIISSANQRTDFNLKYDVCVDADIHDILRQVKSQTKLVIGNLASVLLEEFILAHKSEIIELLKKKTNRLI